MITSGLVCSNPLGYPNYNGVIQGPPPAEVGAASMQGPVFSITAGDAAGSSFSGTAMLTMTQSTCGLSAVGLVGSIQNSQSSLQYDIVDAQTTENSVFNHSQLSGGWNGLNCSGAKADVSVFDSSIVLSGSDGIAAPCPNAKFQRNVISGVGGNGIEYSGTQALIANNVIEQSGGDGILCNGGTMVGIV